MGVCLVVEVLESRFTGGSSLLLAMRTGPFQMPRVSAASSVLIPKRLETAQ